MKLSGGRPNWPMSIYRYFPEEKYAEDFVNGRLKITTLHSCRYHEDSARRDELEGVKFSTINVVTNDLQESAEAMSIMGIDGGGATGFYAYDNISIRYAPDGFLLCSSLELSDRLAEKMGRHCVQILNPEAFTFELTEALCHSVRHGLRVCCGPVIYDAEELNFQNRADWLGRPPGFTKRRDYSEESEFRLYWPCLNPAAFILDAPKLNGLSRRVR
jgi:hypothetical protein